MQPTIDIFGFLIFIVPGAITVWSFRHFTKSTKQGDFEYLAMSAFWSGIILIIQGQIASVDELKKLLSNPYAAMTVFSIIGLFFGWAGSKIVEIKNLRKN